MADKFYIEQLTSVESIILVHVSAVSALPLGKT